MPAHLCVVVFARPSVRVRETALHVIEHELSWTELPSHDGQGGRRSGAVRPGGLAPRSGRGARRGGAVCGGA